MFINIKISSTKNITQSNMQVTNFTSLIYHQRLPTETLASFDPILTEAKHNICSYYGS